ncbi:MAG: DUF3857 domain-containing transglutaminase family protein [Arenimonas sp.]
MFRVVSFFALALVCGAAFAEEKVFQRGEYRFSIAPIPAFVEVQPLAEQWPAEAPGAKDARWRNWLLDSQSDYRNGETLMFLDQVSEAVSPELVSNAAKQQIYFNPAYQSLILHKVELRRNGVWSSRLNPEKITLARRESEFESDMSDGMVSALVVLDDVRAGDVVRFSYTIKGMNPILQGIDHDDVYFDWVDPILSRHVSAKFDPGTNLAHRSFNGAPSAVIKKEKDAVIISATSKQIPAFREEGDYPRWYRPHAGVMFAPQRSWADVVRWAKPLYPDPGAFPKELEEKMLEWKAIANPEQRLMAVLQTMQEDIRYFGIEMGESSHRPAAPADTWNRRFGDCKDKAYLMSVILTRLGIPAVPALATTRFGKGVRDFLPAATAFNHVIVQAQLGKQTLWLDPTLTQQRGTAMAIDTMDYGYVLPIADGITDLREVVRTPTSKRQISVQERYRPSEDGKTVDLQIASEFTGGSADNIRRELASRGDVEMGKNYAEYYRKRFGDLEVLAPFTAKDDPAGNKLVITESYRLKQAWDEKTGNTKSLSVYADSMDSDTKLPGTIDRKTPLSLNYPMQYQHEQILELPTGWSWLGSAEKEVIKSSAFDYERSMAQAERTVAIRQSVRFTEDHVPIGNLPDFLSKMRDVRDGMSRRFVLSTPAAMQGKDRDARLKNILRDAMDNK